MIIQSILVFVMTLGVGALSAVLGLGGGILLVPIFTLLLKMPIHQAVALSLCCVMATSVTSSAKYLAGDLVDLKAVLYLETTTIIGSYFAGRFAGSVSEQGISIIFAALLILSAVTMLVQRASDNGPKVNSRATYPVAMGASVFAGGLVGLLGVGGGIVKVPILQLLIGKSVKQALATSTMMVGISAAVAIIPYMNRGDVPVEWIPFATLGTVAGAFLGSRAFHKIDSLYLRLLFAAVLIYTAISMVLKAVRG